MSSAHANQEEFSEQETKLSLEAELAVEFASGAVQGAAEVLHQDFECVGNKVGTLPLFLPLSHLFD